MQSYGSVNLVDGYWRVRTQPHVALRLKRVFGRIDKRQQGVLSFQANPESSRDLQWFLQRYPHDVEPEDALVRMANQHRENETIVERLLKGKPEPLELQGMRLEPRDYQILGAQMWQTVGGLLLGDEVGVGKAQPLTAKVLTPTGWVFMGQLKVGDEVVDPDGGIGIVEGVYPQGKRRIFDVCISDHSRTQCCDEHLWLLQTSNDRVRKGSRVLALKDFRKKLYRLQPNKKWRISNFFLPPTQPIQYAPRPTPYLHPYCMGLLLGDGGLTGGGINLTCSDEDVRLRFASLLPPGMEMRKEKSSKYDWRVVPCGASRAAGSVPNPVIRWLKSIGIFDKKSPVKSIPEEYLFGSLDDRVELLKGLMDSDGECSKRGNAFFSSTSSLLRDDIAALVRSIGGTATVCPVSKTPSYIDKNGDLVICESSWTVIVKTSFNPFYLKKRAERWRPPLMGRAIVDVKRAGLAETQCIKVSTKRHLYFTDGFIPTHNTATALTGLVQPGMLPALVVTLTHLPWQWKREVEKFTGLTVHILKKAQPYDFTKEFGGRFPDIIITNYHKLSGWADTFANIGLKAVVFDEGHELRHTGTAKYNAAKRIAAGVPHRLALTATPIFNYGSEIFNVIDVLKDGALGTYEEFFTEWCVATYGQKVKIKNPSAFGSYLREAGLMLRRTRKEIKRELPPVTIVPHTIDTDTKVLGKLAGDAAGLARLVLSQKEDFKGQKMQASGEFSVKMRQATGVAKAKYVAEFVKFLHEESGEKIVLYGWHRDVYDIWMRELKHLKPVMYTGSETPAQKEAAREAFVNGDSQVLIISLRAGAGLDGLQKVCHIGVVGELDYSPAVHIQNTGRIDRDEQEEPVIMYYLICDHGSDPVISDILGIKKQQLEGINSPTPDLIETLQIEADYIKKLARDYLKRRGEVIEEQQAA